MWSQNTLRCWGMTLWAGLAAACLLGGCRSAAQQAGGAGPVYFPPPPEQPRLQFLKSFADVRDLGAAGSSGLEKFVLGENEQKDGIATPYGLALFDGKLYVCDVGKRRVEVLDLVKRTFGYLTEDRRLINPVNIFIEEDGTKYVADPTVGVVFVFDASNTLQTILGKDLQIRPIDVAVHGAYCYVTDFASNRVVVLDKATGKELRRIGEQGDADNQFKQVNDLAFGPDGDLYVTDKLKARIFQFDTAGHLKRTLGRLGDRIDELVRPKGIAVDKENRIWVVDSGVSMAQDPWFTEVAKIYDAQGRLLLYFGGPGNEPGRMNLPAKIILDYRHVNLFQQYAVKGAKIEFLVLVSNQYGPGKISVYGFGAFPPPPRPKTPPRKPPVEKSPPVPADVRRTPAEAAPPSTPPSGQSEQVQRMQAMADVYYRSMTLYRAGQLEEARAGFVTVVTSGLIPPAMEQTLRGYLQDIDSRLAGARGTKGTPNGAEHGEGPQP